MVFMLICGALVLLSALFYMVPFRRGSAPDDDVSRANLEWYRLREQELAAEGDETLRDDARLRLLEDDQQGAGNDPRQLAQQSRFPAWTLLPLIAMVSAFLYYQLGAATDVEISRRLQQLGEDASAGEMAQLIDAIEKRAAQRPDNLYYAALLARYYMGQRDYSRAAATYGALAREAPEDAQVLAHAAQAEYLAAGRVLSDSARMQAEQALAVDPHQRTALGLLGMASFEQGGYRAAVEYWERLLAMEAPGSDSANMIASVIRSAREKLGEGPPADQPAQDRSGEVTAGVTVRVNAPEGISPADTVFVLARNARSDSRMPIAVQRITGAQLPVTLRLDDSNSMAGQKLSQTESVLVVVQVSPDGRPGEGTATWLGEAGPLAPGSDTEPVEITLTPTGG